MKRINLKLNKFINQKINFYIRKNGLHHLSNTKIAEELGIHCGTWVNLRYGKAILPPKI